MMLLEEMCMDRTPSRKIKGIGLMDILFDNHDVPS